MFRRAILTRPATFERAGQSHRISLGRGRSGNEDGPLHDLPDFRYADGRPGPQTKARKSAILKKERDLERIESIRQKMDAHIDKRKDLIEQAKVTEQAQKEAKVAKQAKKLYDKRNKLVHSVIESLEKKKAQTSSPPATKIQKQ